MVRGAIAAASVVLSAVSVSSTKMSPPCQYSRSHSSTTSHAPASSTGTRDPHTHSVTVTRWPTP
jgi:hypothetical protein